MVKPEVHSREKSLAFQPGKIGGMVIKNRLVRSATYEGMAAEDGSVTDELVKVYKNLAAGGVGFIIASYAYIQPSGRGMLMQTGIDKDDFIPGLRKIAQTVHEHGNGCKVALQLVHSGRQSFILPETVAPSAILESMRNIVPREMTIAEIEETVEAFAAAVSRAKEAGFDAVQLHAAHGYLLSEFLSPFTNKRTDQYGGSTEKRFKIVEDIYKRSVEKVGKDFPILIKMNADDFLEGGIDLEESKKIAERLSGMGFAAIEISGGMWEVITRSKEELGWEPVLTIEARIGINSKDKEAYHLQYAREIKKVIKVPLILVGGIRSFDVIEEILAEGSADFISLCRALIRQPGLPNKWLKGEAETAKCISCNGCVSSIMIGSLKCTPQAI